MNSTVVPADDYYGVCTTTDDTKFATGDTMGLQQHRTNFGTFLDDKSTVYFENCEIFDLCVTEISCIADLLCSEF